MAEKRKDKLELYRKKRDPERTPEPFGGRRSAERRLFVIQKHAARRLHYDLRLEIDGVLKSWSVPKGPSTRPGEKRLAVQVEDHPIDYAGFEGVIPPENYGAGSVIIWDRGTYISFKQGDLLQFLEQGKLELEFFGYKMRGQWILTRMSKSEKDWLLFKKGASYVGEKDLTERYPESIVSGLTVDEMADVEGKLSFLRSRLKASAAQKRQIPAHGRELMLATLGEGPFSGPEWLFEIKYDGVRVLAVRNGADVRLYGRRGSAITHRYPEVAEALQRLPVENFLIDGEIVALDENGKPSFQKLQARMGLSRPLDVKRAAEAFPVTGVFFDCMAMEGYDLRSLPLLERKKFLKELLPPLGSIHRGDHVLKEGAAFFEAASEQGLEGVVAKKINSRYVGRRSRDWIKIKCQRRQEFVIGGYTDPQGGRKYFGALHVGLYEGSRLIYVSKVGTGFDAGMLKTIWDKMQPKMQPLMRSASPFDVRKPRGRGHHWIEPDLVCEVRFAEWTDDGGLRAPVFLGLRTDKPPEDCRREQPKPVDLLSLKEEAETVSGAPGRSGDRKAKLTNLGKIFWPGEGYTKGELIDYYRRIAPLLLPYLRNRPVVLVRYPDGIEGKSFFQKDAPQFVPDWIRTEQIYSKDAGREIDYFVVNDLETLLYVINLGTIPLHLWSCRINSLDRPDWLVIDLDPKGAPFMDVVRVARVLYDILNELRLPGFAKTSGASGLHILVPLGARYGHDEARNFARLVAMLGAARAPKIATVARQLGERDGKVYIDFGQNGHGRTIVSPFAVRSLPGAPVSCPLRWTEINRRLDPRRFTIKTVLRRFQTRKDPMAPLFKASADIPAALRRLERILGRIELAK